MMTCVGMPPQVGEPLALDRLEDRGGVERVVHERRAAVPDLNRDARHRPDVREREPGGEVLLEGRRARGVAPRVDLGDRAEVPVREARALRDAGRAAREDDRDRVVRRDGNRRRAAAPEGGDRVRVLASVSGASQTTSRSAGGPSTIARKSASCQRATPTRRTAPERRRTCPISVRR
jgi:hypothetical protein